MISYVGGVNFMFHTLADAGTNISMIPTSKVAEEFAPETCVRTLHESFELGNA